MLRSRPQAGRNRYLLVDDTPMKKVYALVFPPRQTHQIRAKDIFRDADIRI